MSDTRQLVVFCEGPTEQGFCRQLLQPFLFPSGDGLVHTLPVGEKDHHHVFGLGKRKKYAGGRGVRQFICNTIKQRQGKNVFFTTLFDLYALPSDFPGKAVAVRNPANPTPYVGAIETAFAQDINHPSFVAYLQLHEYETMLFANPSVFEQVFENCSDGVQELQTIIGSVPSIEHINDGPNTAPSKRIGKAIAAYNGRKSTAGPDLAEKIGIATIRDKCPHVDAWLNQLSSLPWTD